jgi:ribosomal-protein-alanine N-acetyltransferase
LNPVKLESERLILKSLTAGDAENYYIFLMRNAEFLKPWSPAYKQDYFNLEHHKKRFEHMEKETIEGRYIKFGIYLTNDTKTIIGSVSLSGIIHGPFKSSYIAYQIDEKQNGRGYATESVKCCIDYAFNTLKLHRLEANVIPRNKASIRVVEKLGFTSEGLSKKYLQINGVWEDHMHYVLLNESVE